jgi:restriction endonuclease S subunit
MSNHLPLGECLNHILDFRGRTPLKLGMDWGGGNIPALSANNVRDGYIDFQKECNVGDDSLYKAWMTRGDCRKGDILFTMEAPMGNVAQIPDNGKYILSQRVILMSPKGSVVCGDYLYHFLRSDEFRKQCDYLATGTTAKGIKQSNLVGTEIAVPPLPEQKKIAEILSGIDKVIAIDRSMLLKIDHAIQAVRDKTQSCYGEEKKIGNLISKISTGVSVSGENRPCRPSEQGVLKVSCVSKGEFLPSENKVIDDENKGRATMSIKKGMLLVSRANTPELVGACGITSKDYKNLFLPDKIWNLEIQESSGCSKRWLNNALNSQVAKARIRDASTGTSDSMRNISQGNFCAIDILVPPLEIQQQQSDLIDSLLRRKHILATRLEIHLLLKSALSADLLSGRKRVSI